MNDGAIGTMEKFLLALLSVALSADVNVSVCEYEALPFTDDKGRGWGVDIYPLASDKFAICLSGPEGTLIPNEKTAELARDTHIRLEALRDKLEREEVNE